MTPFRDLSEGLRAAFSSPRVRVLLALTAILIGGAAVFYHLVEGWGWIDAIYFSVITISTVGYGDFAPQTALGKIFTSVYVLFGLGLFVAAATAIGDSIIARANRDNDETP
ncbi:potassium channel family protein [Paracoccus sediminicola]|uniref:potassium channel family protein n=1 Tax=Paracoccus sediminicola TaxID=3017783 RepID=UPI0022F13228|nr:potassium channel family protein [Paracoccus sediminicola]WBU56114.1 potassium channel family protein [Paracoccus sediminicola]